MKILFLGGTRFVGRHLVETALARGHQVTLFHRGQTNPGLFSDADELFGDRNGNLEPLRNHSWDSVVDVNGYVPRLVRDSAEFLKENVRQYLFISTGSVYDFEHLGAFSDENAPLERLEDKTTEDYHGAAYGGLKVLCEQVVREVFPERHIIQRLGVVAGPYDPSDRVTYWVNRVARGGEMLVPGRPERRIQFIDARDMAAFAISALEKALNGTFNTLGNSISWSQFLDACWQAAGRPGVRIDWVHDFAFLEAENPNQDYPGGFPLALPPEYDQANTFVNDRALNHGLVFRSTLNTARDILFWERTRPSEYTWRAGVSEAKERQMLVAWKQKIETLT